MWAVLLYNHPLNCEIDVAISTNACIVATLILTIKIEEDMDTVPQQLLTCYFW